jgi:cytochrome P450
MRHRASGLRMASLLHLIPSAFKTKKTRQCREFSVHQTSLGCELNIHSIETAKTLFLKHFPVRYKPLVSLLRTTLRHRVMIVADGEDWQRTHDAINPEFHAGLVTSEYAPVIRAVADEAFSKFASRAGNAALSTTAVEIDLESLMRSVTSSVLGHVLFGQALPLEEAEYLEKTLSIATQSIENGIPALINTGVGAVLRALNLAAHQPVVVPKAQRRAVENIMEWISLKVDQAGRATPRPPLLDSLKTRYSGQRPAQLKRCIAAEYMMLFIAGIETTAAALTFAIVEIANNPAVREQATDEARQEPTDGYGNLSLAARYPYMHCVFRETLRRHTVVPTLLRETEAEYELSGEKRDSGSRETVQIRKGSILRCLPIQGHMRPSIWLDPSGFDPLRFARPLTDKQAINYVPFGFGPQKCPGHAMATSEAVLILLAFFRKFDVEIKQTAQSIPVERNVLFTNRPVGVTARLYAAQNL